MENLIYAKLLIAIKAEIAQATEIIIASLKQNPQEIHSPIPQQSTVERYLRPKEVQAMLSVSENKLKDMRLKNQVPFTKIGSSYRYPEREIVQIMNSNRL